MGNVNAIFPFFCVKCAYPCKRTPFFFNSFPEIHISDADSRPAAAQKEKNRRPVFGTPVQLVKEPRRVCARRRKESSIIFFGDMCGEENTSRPANVRAVRRRRRTARALQSGRQPLCQKSNTFLTVSTGVPFSGRRSGSGSVYARLAQKPSNIVAIWSRVALPCGARKT